MKLSMLLLVFAFVPMAAHANIPITSCGNSNDQTTITTAGTYDVSSITRTDSSWYCIYVNGVTTGSYILFNCHGNTITDATGGAGFIRVSNTSIPVYFQNCTFNN